MACKRRPRSAKSPTRARRRWSPPTSAPAIAAVAPAILQPAEPFLDLSGEDIRRRMFLTTAPRRRRILPAPRPHHSRLAQLPRLSRGRPAGGLLLSRPGFPPPPRRRRPSSCRPASNRSAAPTGGRRRRDARARRWTRPRITAHARPDIRHRRRRAVRRADRGLDLPPAWRRRLVKDFNRNANLAQDLDRLVPGGNNARPDYQGVLAALAGSDPTARVRWSPTCCRSPASTRSAAARSAKSPTASSNRRRSAAARNCRAKARADRALPRHQPASPRGGARAARARRDSQALALAPAVDLFESRTGFLAARGIDLKRAHLLHRFRPRLRLLHRLRVRAARPHARRRPARSPAAATTGCSRGLARLSRAAVGFAVWLDGRASGGAAMSAPLVLAVPSKGRLQEQRGGTSSPLPA